jgi:hypothetical protein
MGGKASGLAGFRERQSGRNEAELALFLQQPVGAEIPPARAVEDIVEAHALERCRPGGAGAQRVGDETAPGFRASGRGNQLGPSRSRHESSRAADEAFEAQSEAALEMGLGLSDAQGRCRAESAADRQIGHDAEALAPRRFGEGPQRRLVIAQPGVARIAGQHPVESHPRDAGKMVEPGVDRADERREEIVDPRTLAKPGRIRPRDRRLPLAAHRHLIHVHAYLRGRGELAGRQTEGKETIIARAISPPFSPTMSTATGPVSRTVLTP